MNIFENKRAVALTGIFTLAFAGIVAWGCSNKSKADTIIKEANENAQTLASITDSNLPPKPETQALLNKGTKALKERINMLTKDLKPYTATCKAITADAISKELLFHPEHLAAARNWLNKKAGKCEIPGGDGFTFGLDRNYNERNDAATTETTPFLLYQINAARTVAGYVAEAGAGAITRMYCEPVPTEEYGTYTPLHIEISFTAPRGEIPTNAAHTSTLTRIINALLRGKGEIVSRKEERGEANYFFTIKGINISSNNTYEPLATYSEPYSTAGDATPPSVSIAERKTGDADETIQVNMVIEAVYFSQNAN